MTPLSGDERRALAILAALLLLASAARWLERPRSILDDVPDVDVASLEEASRVAHDDRNAAPTRRRSRRTTPPAPDSVARDASGYTTSPKIDPNLASSEELERLPGVGPALAARIIAERERALFASADDMRRVFGIGPALAARLAEHITLPRSAEAGRDGARATNHAATTSPDTRAPTRDDAPIELNTASAEQLRRIAGVGPAIAARIIARRDSLGRFRTYDDVDAVPGIGPALLARIQAATVLR